MKLKFWTLAFIINITFINSNDYGIKNIFEREKDIESSTIKNELRYIIKEELEKYYTNEIEIYIALVEPNIVNRIKMANDTNSLESLKTSYYANYENLLGPTTNFFPINITKELITNTSYYDKQRNETKFLNQSDILMRIVKDEIKGNNVKYYFMRNILFHHFNGNCDFRELTWNKFYDLNLVIKNNTEKPSVCDKEINKLISENPNNYVIVEEGDTYKNNNFTENLLNNNIKMKVERRIHINDILNRRIYNRKEYSLNLKHYLLEKDIQKVNQKLEEISKELVFIDSHIVSSDQKLFEQRVNKLNAKIDQFFEVLNNFNISLKKSANYVYYILLFLIFLILLYLSTKTVKEIMESYKKKII